MKIPRECAQGFTLLEVLVVLAISSIVMTAIFAVFDNSNKSYMLQEDIAKLQQNLRIAKTYIESDLRMTGYGVTIQNFEYDEVVLDPISVENNVKGQSGILGATDKLSLVYIDDCCSDVPKTKASCADLPQLLLDGKKPPSSSAANVKENLGVSPYSRWDQGCSCNGVDYDSPHFGFQVIVRAPDDSMSGVALINQVIRGGVGSGSSLLNHPYKIGKKLYKNKTLNEYPDGSTINFGFVSHIKYYVDDELFFRREGTNGSAIKISENIEDVQYSFCGDYNGDGKVSLDFNPAKPDDSSDDWFDEKNLTGGTMSAADMAKIRFVRVSILGRTDHEHQGMKDSRPAIEDHAASTQVDGFHRRLLSFTVKIRNLGLNE